MTHLGVRYVARCVLTHLGVRYLPRCVLTHLLLDTLLGVY